MFGKSIGFLLAVFSTMLFATTAARAGEAAPAPAMVAYDQVQKIRHEANALIGNQAAAVDFHAAVDLLQEALRILDQPENVELAEGNMYLRFRRFDVHRDLALDYAGLGDSAAALDHLEATARVGIVGDVFAHMLADSPALQKLQSEPRLQRLLLQEAAIGRLWNHPAIAVPYAADLTPEERIAGLSLFWSEVNYNFAYFDHVPDLDWDKTYLDFLPRVLTARTTADYYDVLMQLAPLLRDGHTNIYPPEELADRFYARPPLRTELIEGRVLVREVWSPTLERQGIHSGDEIVSIDGQPVRVFGEQRVRPYQSSSTPQDADVRIYTYALLAGDVSKSLTLSVRNGRGREHTVTVARSGYTDVRRPMPAAFRELGDGVAYVKLDQFENDTPVKAFEKVLPDILKSKALVIDVRANGGGSSNYGLRVLSYLTREPVPIPTSRVRNYDAFLRARGGAGMVWNDVTEPPESMRQEKFFAGPVAVLIGPRTFSAGEDFVASFDLMQRGLLVGAATGGSTGQPMVFKLPGGGSARICVKRDEYPDGREFVGKGIEPKIAVSPTVADLRAGRDPVIERAKSELLKGLGRQK